MIESQSNSDIVEDIPLVILQRNNLSKCGLESRSELQLATMKTSAARNFQDNLDKRRFSVIPAEDFEDVWLKREMM